MYHFPSLLLDLGCVECGVVLVLLLVLLMEEEVEGVEDEQW